MQLHQILTGSCNIKDQCISYGSLYSFTFIAYGSGSDLVILNNDFIRHQIIQGKFENNSQINAVSCSKYSGKILVLYSDLIHIYEPQHLSEKGSESGLNRFSWVSSCQLTNNDESFKDLCWVPKVIDTVILVGSTIQIWSKKELTPSFSIGIETELKATWNCICKRNCPDDNDIERIKFSPDGKFFATFSTNSKDLFVWFWDQNSALSTTGDTNYSASLELFDFISIKHPTFIISFEWRNISNFLPRNSINNALLTCCDDKVCRVWSESHLHRHIKSNVNQNCQDSKNAEGVAHNEVKFSDHLKNIFFAFLQKAESKIENPTVDHINYDLNDISTYDINKTYLYPKFVLSAAINDTSDIPLFSSGSGGVDAHHPLIVHWLDNKELDLTIRIESNLRHLTSDVTSLKESDEQSNKDISLTDKLSQFKRNVIFALEKWKKSSDVVFAIHPQNGSLLVWLIHNLDDSGGHSVDNKALNVNRSIYIKNAQISVHSCLPNCVPVADAATMCSNILLYCDQVQHKSFFQDICSDEEFSLINMSNVNYDIKMISKQQNGSLNMWNLMVSSEDTGHSLILNMRHLSRISGHRWQTNSAACHIQLPLLLTISNLEEKKTNNVSEVSELILWRIKQVGPFSKSGGITEIARVNSKKYLNFSNIAWFPGTVPSQLLGLGISSPSSFFMATDSKSILYIYLSITNVHDFLKNELYKKENIMTEGKSVFKLISLASTGEPGCILSAGTLKMDAIDINREGENTKTLFLHVFTKETIVGIFESTENENPSYEIESKYNEIYYAVRIISYDKHGSQNTYIEMWLIHISESTKEQGKKTLDDLIKLSIDNDKVYNEQIDIPYGVTISKVVPASGHLSSASVYPQCLSPYLLALVCSDNSVRFFHCLTKSCGSELSYKWQEWTMELTDQCSSSIVLKETCSPLNISCAYSGRIAVAYSNSMDNYLKDISVDIFECESSGGSEWILEDSIKLTDTLVFSVSSQGLAKNVGKDMEKNQMIKDFLLIDWVNSEDGSHLLSVSIGAQLFIFTTSCSEIAKYQRFESEIPSNNKFSRWMKVKEITLKSSDSNLPDHISWAREGLLIVGLNNELHVYNQWNDKTNEFNDHVDFNESRGGYKLVDNDRDLTEIMKITPNANFSIARLQDAYYSSNDFKRSQSKTYLKNIEIEFEPNLSCDEFLQNSALFEAAQIHNPVLPQYHPKQLMEWINFGKISRVMAILSHLTSCTSDIIMDTSYISQKTTENSGAQNKESDDLSEKNRLEIKAIPPLPLHILLEIDMENEKKLEKKDGDDLFAGDVEHNEVMDFNILNQNEDSSFDAEKSHVPKVAEPKSWMVFQSLSQLLYFGPEQARQLSECLVHIQLPGLSTLDQVYLLGIAELVSNIKSNYPISPSYMKTAANLNDKINQHQDSTESLDDCGLRFLLAMQHFSYMTRTLPTNQRTTLLNQGIDTASLIWGFHSETEDELCSRLDEMSPQGITWDDFKRYGCGWWILNDVTLQRVVEKITKNIFQKTKDPMDAAIFYLAMGKQKVLSKLFKTCNKDGLETFFMLDFSLPENRSRALSQAFKMRSKRRYDHAVALFLLCKSIDDALLICLHNLKDIQMALTISRLYDINVTRNSKNLESIITNHVIENDDPFIRSMGYWMIKEYSKSLDTLLQKSPNKTSECIIKNTYSTNDPVVFVFYNFLKKHPIILRQNVILNKVLGDQDSVFNKEDNITPMERRLFFKTAYTYLRMGSPDLALEVLSKLPEKISTIKDEIIDKSERIRKTTEIRDEVLVTGLINWDDFTDFAPVQTPDFRIEIDNTDDDDAFHASDKEKAVDESGQLDIMCLQYKFMICLKLISEELCTLATGIETNGSYLRYNFYTWLEKEVQVLHFMCRHAPHSLSSSHLKFDDFGPFSSNQAMLSASGPLKDNAKKHEIETRKLWLKTNNSLILSLYSFCSLRGPSIVGLASIRMELLILIQELQGSSCFENDLCKSLPSSVNLPFINSALSPDNGLITTPVQHLKTLVTDIMDCVNNFKCPFAFLFHHSTNCTKKSDNEIQLNRNKIKLLRSQCQALSACLHQCLSNFENHNIGDEPLNPKIRHSSTTVIYSPESDIHLRSKKLSEASSDNINPNSDPRNWPGFTNLIHLISNSIKKDIFNFSYLLGEAIVVVYVGILVYALHLNDANLLYRLTNVDFNKAFWGKVFGGTLRKKPMRPADPPLSTSTKESPKIVNETKGSSPTFPASPCISRNRLYANLVPPIKPQPASIEEKFIPPFHSILTSLLEKPIINRDVNDFIYNSDDEQSSDVEDDNSSTESETNSSRDSECENSKSYTWSLLRLIILHATKSQVLNLVKLLQIESAELAIFCPNIFTVIKCLNRWEGQCRICLFNFLDVPRSYCDLLTECDIKEPGEKSSRSEMASNRINKICKQLMKKDNVPFISHNRLSLSMKRLWINLIGNTKLQPLFIQHLLYLNDKNKENDFNQKVDSHTKLNTINNNQQSDSGLKSIKIIHKEHECIYSLAVNQIGKSIVAACTSKEIIELNLNNLTNPDQWMKDDFDYLLDIVKDPSVKENKMTTRVSEYAFSNDFLLVTPTFGSHINYISQNYSELSHVFPFNLTKLSEMSSDLALDKSRKAIQTTMKRPINGVQILKSHPTLPYYLAGNHSGQVSVFEWGNETPIVKTYSPIQKGKITSLNFDESGNKFGMGDSEGNFSLCHFSYADNSRAQYFNTRCPHKGVIDFCFLNSSSIVAKIGGSNVTGMSSVNHLHAVSGGISTYDSNSINISIWDTLLPPGRNQVRSFSDPILAVGVCSMCYSSRYEALIIGTRKGEVAIIDLKQSAIRCNFQAHESSITSIKLDPLQFYFVSSSADGSIKIWNLFTQDLLESYRSDPVKSSVFRQADIGIKSLTIIDDDKLLSCGADGFIRLRYLDPKVLNNNINFDSVSF